MISNDLIIEKNVIQSLNPKGMLQAVKAVCAKLGGVETVELADALDRFSQVRQSVTLL